MFFSTYVLTKKGALAKIWLAAHWDRRLTRNEVRVVDLRKSVVDIVQPVVPIALRTSGELLVGVVRIYALKVKHLLKDASDATLMLRVTTLSKKAASMPLNNNNNNNNSNDNNKGEVAAGTLLDGVLLSGNGDIDAVTFGWVGSIASPLTTTGKTDAEALEARFDDIADLLHGSKQLKGGAGSSENTDATAFLTSSWYAVEPGSQGSELNTTQHDYDEIARMRADMAAFGDRVSGSSSSKKSSIPSIEKARSSGVTAGAVAGVEDFLAFPPPGDELDIGVPLPDDQALFPDFMIPPHGAEGDPFVISDMLQQPMTTTPTQKPMPRKARVVNMLDLAATTVSGETVRGWMENRGDIIDAAPRRGPYDTEEARDRSTLTQDSNKNDLWANVTAAPLAWIPNPEIRSLYTFMLQPSVAQAEASTMPPQPYSIPAGGIEEEELAFNARAGENGEEMNFMSGMREGRKRGRDDDEDDDNMNGSTKNGGLSSAAMATLKRIRDELAVQKPLKRTRKDATVPANRDRCLIQEVCRGMHRRDAARAFVNILALASKQFVWAKQSPSSGNVELGLLSGAESLLFVA